jgi:hypothetical protein
MWEKKMKRKVLAVLAAAAAVLLFGMQQSFATVRRMECREWADKEYRGLFQFTFDDDHEPLAVVYKPEGKYPLFGQSVETWKLLWRKELMAVFYGITDDWWAPVKVLSLHFGQVQMFPYGLGSVSEESTLVSKIHRVCNRLD